MASFFRMHFWILSSLAPRKGFDFEIRKPFETSFSLRWGWLTTCWYALRTLSSWNNPHSLGFCGSTSWFWPQLCGDLGSTVPSTNFLSSFSFFQWPLSCYESSFVNIPFKNFKVVQVRVFDYFIDGLSQGILQTSLGKEFLSDSRASRIYSKNAEASQWIKKFFLFH